MDYQVRTNSVLVTELVRTCPVKIYRGSRGVPRPVKDRKFRHYLSLIPSAPICNPVQEFFLLSDEHMQEPFTVLEDLCTDFGLGQLRNSLSETLEICLTEDDIFRDADKRAQLICMYKTMEKLVEAVFVIVHQRQWNGHYQ